ncbi:hypothetical protein DPMN_096558 [Dreissena polymorpha]|uniref:Uncharacterized protein n=1 Tax=Dreissena polymorpha TaxID=45954 RepID=A0A9D4L9Y9_DREPO|nr:hypothetical protein DPMN_096558 [Dreissena polymorpha]
MLRRTTFSLKGFLLLHVRPPTGLLPITDLLPFGINLVKGLGIRAKTSQIKRLSNLRPARADLP